MTDDYNYFEDPNGRPVMPIFEMANVAPEDHQFGVGLTMHILQPGDRWPGHGPRVKFFKNHPDRDGFSVTLHPDPDKIFIVDRQEEQVASTREENILLFMSENIVSLSGTCITTAT